VNCERKFERKLWPHLEPVRPNNEIIMLWKEQVNEYWEMQSMHSLWYDILEDKIYMGV
jgi:hypothetical protein